MGLKFNREQLRLAGIKDKQARNRPATVAQVEKLVDRLYENTATSQGGLTFTPETYAPDTVTDWREYIQAALDAAYEVGGEVILDAKSYQISDKITIRQGVTLRGSGRGETAFGAGPSKGTVIRCTGANTRAVEVRGAFAAVCDLAIIGESRFAGTSHGLVFDGVGDGSSSEYLLESCYVNNVLIHSCNYGLYLVAGNAGSVTYSNFCNIRIRDCQEHMKIHIMSANAIYSNVDNDGNPFSAETGFINSNKFSGLYMSGFAKYGLHIVSEKQTAQIDGADVFLPANNLLFDGVVIEPPYSEFGHIVLEGGGSQVRMHDIRIEALNQGVNFNDTPIVKLGEGVNSCWFNMDQQSVTMVDLGYNNTFEVKGSKSAFITPNSDNLYTNVPLVGLKDNAGTWELPGWTIEEQFVGAVGSYAWRPLETGSNITLQYSATERQDGYKALEFVVPPKYQLRMYQNVDRDIYKLDNVTVHCWAITTDREDLQWTYQDEKTPIVASGASYGTAQFGGDYEPIGGWFPVRDPNDVSYYRIPIFCQNVAEEGSGDNITFTVTQPQFVKGTIPKNIPERYMTEKGGTFYGPVGYNMVESVLPITESAEWTDAVGSIVLPLEGSFFEFAEAGFTIQKINSNIKRFPRGSQITLYFGVAGPSIVESTLIKLHSPFTAQEGDAITLYSRYGDGVWEEVSRSSRQTSGYNTYDADAIITSTSMDLPETGENYFNITNTVQANTFDRINNATNRFPAGSVITMQFSDIDFTLTLTGTAFTTRNADGDYVPANGDWIQFITSGNGTWQEIARKQSESTSQSIGSTTIEAEVEIADQGVANRLPLDTTKNYITINNTVSTQNIARINDVVRYPAGSKVLLRFGTISQTLTIIDSAYISLKGSENYLPLSGDWIEFITTGDGTWIEVARIPSTKTPATVGYQEVASGDVLSGGFLTLPLDGTNFFGINTSVSGGSIQRINQASDRFPGGTILLIKSTDATIGTTIINSGYITLSGGVNFSMAVNDVIALFTTGNGLWTEAWRVIA